MENKYRLLDVGEDYRDGDDILTVSEGWRSVSGYGTVQAHTVPMRRPDDGKGNYVICGSIAGTQFWRWGVGWVKWESSPSRHKGTGEVWRKPREVVPDGEKESPTGLWVVIQTSGNKDGWMVSHSRKYYSSWKSACAEAKQLAREGGDGAEFCVCHMDRSFLCVVEVVEKEVGK